MEALSYKYEKAFERANDWFRNDTLSRSALHEMSGSVSKQMAQSFQTTLIKCGISCCGILKDVKNGDSICAQLSAALAPFKGANTEDFSSALEDDEDVEGIKADASEWETLLGIVVRACVLIEKEGKRTPVAVANGTPDFSRPRMVTVDTYSMAYIGSKIVEKSAAELIRQDPWTTFFDADALRKLGGKTQDLQAV